MEMLFFLNSPGLLGKSQVDTLSQSLSRALHMTTPRRVCLYVEISNIRLTGTEIGTFWTSTSTVPL
jgi:hypothetical protein